MTLMTMKRGKMWQGSTKTDQFAGIYSEMHLVDKTTEKANRYQASVSFKNHQEVGPARELMVAHRNHRSIDRLTCSRPHPLPTSKSRPAVAVSCLSTLVGSLVQAHQHRWQPLHMNHQVPYRLNHLSITLLPEQACR